MSLAGILIILGFFIFAALMVARIIPPLLTLPLMAAWTCQVAHLPINDYLNVILLAGSMKLAGAMAVVIFGAMFARVIMKAGISDSLIKKAAELAGDQPRFIAILIFGAVVFVFLGMSGLGAVIMAGSIALPIMTGAGIAPLDAAVILVLGISTGLMANLANYGTYIGIFGGQVVTECYPPALLICGLFSLLYIFVNIRAGKNSHGSFVGIIKLLILGAVSVPGSFVKSLGGVFQVQETTLFSKKDNTPAAALVTPAIPLITVYAFRYICGFNVKEGGVDPVAAAICGFILASVYAVLLTKPRELINIMAGAIVEGIRDVAGVLFLFMGIGMLVAAVMHPAVAAVLNPLLLDVVPKSSVGLALFFAILAPTALYRGPLNMFGMGAGIAVLLYALHLIEPAVLCGMFIGVQFLQGISDPTNSSNTWIADFVRADTGDILRKTLPYSWGMCLAMLLVVLIRQGGL